MLVVYFYSQKREMTNFSPEALLRRRIRRVANTIPQPKLKNKLVFTEIDGVIYMKRRSRVIPFGYKLCETNKHLLEPIPLELEALKRARTYIQSRASYVEVSAWITQVTGRRLPRTGLYKALRRGY